MRTRQSSINRTAARRAVAPIEAPLARRGRVATAALGVTLLLAVSAVWPSKPAAAALESVTVYKSPSCTCCGKWMERMREHGFAVAERNIIDVSSVKREWEVPTGLYSCHTSVVGGYSIEGHVPPDLVERVLRERQAIAGLAVAGMPASAPGMEVRNGRYQVMSFTRDGGTAVVASR